MNYCCLKYHRHLSVEDIVQRVGKEPSGLNEDSRCRPVSPPTTHYMPLSLAVNTLHFQMDKGKHVLLGSTGLKDGVLESGLMPSMSDPTQL